MRNPTLAVCLVALSCVTTVNSQLTVTVDKSGSYSLLVGGVTWLSSGDTSFNSNGKTFSTADKSLLLSKMATTKGQDMLGFWEATELNYLAENIAVTASIKMYTDPRQPFAIFTQTYTSGANITSAKDSSHVISSFPSFSLQSPNNSTNLGFLSYGGDQSGYDGLTLGRWKPGVRFATGIEGGPLVLFGSSNDALIISPLTQFMVASNANLKGEQIAWGIMGLVDIVPAGYNISFIVYHSYMGINQGLQDWGELLRRFYGKSQERRWTDPTINYLGYYTDNGAYYYYNREKDKNYEETIVDIAKYFNDVDMPFKYIQFDSWWYAKGSSGGVMLWTPMEDIFPHGFSYLYDKTKLPIGCHNRYWDINTPYARYNGGNYSFIGDDTSHMAVPDDDQFWVDLFNRTQEWGKFILYEQDWLNKETAMNQVLLSDLFAGRRWLVGMGNGAAQFEDINIQYCMADSRHIMQSLEIPVVTQARVSRDYHPDRKQWNIGMTSIFADAMGLAPFKDTLWSTSDEPGNPYQKSEPYPRLNQVIATLSTGSVAPGDGIGNLNKTLIMRCCDADGLILKPSKPATAIDAQIKRAALGPSYPGPDGEIWTTYSNISYIYFGIILAAGGGDTYSFVPSDAWPNFVFPTSMVYSGTKQDNPRPFNSSYPLNLGSECTLTDFCLYYTTPVLPLDHRYEKKQNKTIMAFARTFLFVHF